MGGAAGQRAGLLRGGRGSGDAGRAAVRREGGAGRGGGWNCCAASAQRTVLLRGVLGCGDAGGAAALRAGRAAALRVRLPADGARWKGLRRGRRGFCAAGGAAARREGLLRGGRGCSAADWADAANGADARLTGWRTVLLHGGRE